MDNIIKKVIRDLNYPTIKKNVNGIICDDIFINPEIKTNNISELISDNGVNIENINISDNILSTLENEDITIIPDGIGNINLQKDVYISNNLIINDTLTSTEDNFDIGETININRSINRVGINKTASYDLDVLGTINANNIFMNNALLVPTGSIISYVSEIAPSGWLLCDGSAISRSIYSNLFAIIGVTFGLGDGSITFNLPNLRDRVPLGKSNDNTIGDIGGNSTHTLTVDELPSHTHTGITNSSGSHSHGFIMAKDDGNSSHTIGQHPAGDASPSSNPYIINTESSGNHTHNFTTNSTGNGNAFNILPPYLILNYIIKI